MSEAKPKRIFMIMDLLYTPEGWTMKDTLGLDMTIMNAMVLRTCKSHEITKTLAQNM